MPPVQRQQTNQNNQQMQHHFFPITPSDVEGGEIKYVPIANEILNNGKYDRLRLLSSSDVEVILKIMKKYLEKQNPQSKNEPETTPTKIEQINVENEPQIIVHDIVVKKIISKQDENIENSNQDKQIIDEKQLDKIQKEINDEIIKNSVNNLIIINDEEYNIDEYVEPDHYNDLMISLNHPVYNVTGIQIQNCEIVRNVNNINNYNNMLMLNYDGNNISIKISPDNYEIETLIKEINNLFLQNNIEINCQLRSDKHVILQSNKDFILDNKEHSILTILGYVDEVYSGNTEYISDNKYLLETNTTPVLQLIYNGRKKLLCNYEITSDISEMKMFNEPIEQLEKLIIRIIQKDNILYDLGGIAPKLTMKFIQKD